MVSIIIPTLNSGKHIDELLNRLLLQNLDQKEIIIIDSSSSDNTVEIAKAYDARVLVIEEEDFDHGGTRNMAIKEAKGDIVVFLTQDALPADERSLPLLIAPFCVDDTIAATYGRQVPHENATTFAKHIRYFNYPGESWVRSMEKKERGIKVPFLSNSFAAYRKSALQEVGGFKENLISTEDTYAGAKLLIAGYKLAYVAEALVYHSHNYTLSQEFKRYFDIGVFHTRERWILETFGKAEGEGARYLKSEIAFLMGNGKYSLLPEMAMRNMLKYIGYFMGRHYEIMPGILIRKMSMHKAWWDKLLNLDGKK